tara:strand:- start:10 stop:303 length:294 start_codon:yes stop_codon:yes gene_type:complete
MTFAQYLKIETSLGGISCTDKQFIKACLNFILPQAKHHHIYRKARHAFIRDGLDYLNNSRRLAFGMKIKRNYTEPPTSEDIDNAWHFHKSGCWQDCY